MWTFILVIYVQSVQRALMNFSVSHPFRALPRSPSPILPGLCRHHPLQSLLLPNRRFQTPAGSTNGGWNSGKSQRESSNTEKAATEFSSLFSLSFFVERNALHLLKDKRCLFVCCDKTFRYTLRSSWSSFSHSGTASSVVPVTRERKRSLSKW